MEELVAKNSMPTNRSTEEIATEINTLKEQTAKTILINSIEIGRRLVEAKKLVDHGYWGDWLKEKVDYSQRTANNLMKIYEEYGENQPSLFGEKSNSQSLANIGYTKAVALLGVPANEREEFAEKHNIKNISTRELQELIKERDQAIKEKEKIIDELDKANLTAEQKEKEAEKLLEEKRKAEAELIESNIKKKKAEEVVSELKKQLNDRPIEINASEIVEKIPEDVEKELNELRKKVNQSADKDETIVKFSIYFSELVKSFNDLLKSLEEIDDSDEYTKRKDAVSKLINKMNERL